MHSLLALIHVAALAVAVFLIGRHWRGRVQLRALERALFQEIAPLRRQAMAMAAEIERRHRAGEGFTPPFFDLWRLSAPIIYPAMGPALARLPGGTLDRIGYFHAQLADARARLAEARLAGGFAPSPYRMLSCLVRSVNHIEPWYGRVAQSLGHIEETTPDLAGANALLGDFEERAEEPLVEAYCWADCAHRVSPDAAS